MSTSTQDQTYNGWTNYETWGVALVLDNDEDTYRYAHAMAVGVKHEAPDASEVADGIWDQTQYARFTLADRLRDYTETLCGIGSESEDYGIPQPTLMAQQLLGGAISDVNWDEIADHYLEDE